MEYGGLTQLKWVRSAASGMHPLALSGFRWQSDSVCAASFHAEERKQERAKDTEK
jgi:hypothetical protein